MAQTENGHCSTCQVQNSASSCGGSAQSFKQIVGSSTVENHEKYLKLKSLIPQINKRTDLITKEVWDQITEILQALKDYGQIDEFNPTQEKINNTIVNKGNPVFLDNYNTILTALDRNNISGSQIITQELIDNLKTYINKYELDATRCDVCNTSGCQVPQCCDSNCHSDPCYGGGGLCQGCDAGGERYGSCVGGWESARIYKENIQDYTQNALDIINATKIVEFNYKLDPEKNQKIGFIADDTDAQLASKDHNIMDMYNCIGVLLKAVQELSAEIEKLKKQKKEEFN